MSKGLPKYCSLNTGRSKTLTYQRRYPKDIAALVGKTLYKYPLGLAPPPASSESALAKAVEQATEVFELKCKQARNSDAEVFSDREVDLLAAELLRKEGLRAGEFAGYDGPADPAGDVTGAVSDDELGPNPTVEDKARQVAYRALMSAKDAPKTLTINELLDAYLESKPRQGKALADLTRNWRRAMAHVGDTFANPDAVGRIHAGLDAWVAERLQEVTAGSVQRGLNDVVSVLRWASRRYRIGWHIETPELPEHTAKSKHPFTREEQRRLVEACQQWGDGVAAAILMMLQGGMMPSEIGRLDMEATVESLAAENPHVLIGYGGTQTKTDSRKRIVPVVVEPELVREHLIEGIRWAAGVKEGTGSATINKRLRSAGFDKTGHSLRHTLSQNLKAAGVSGLQGAQIAGWKSDSSVPEKMMHYGAEGVSEYLQPLTEASRQAHRHLLTRDSPDGNVVPMRKRGGEQ